MAKKAILEVLESTIGRYVLNLDAESLNVAVWSGKIELHSLALDVSAVNSELRRRARDAPNLASPFRVKEGRFDSVQLDVPWARLSSRPVVFRARGLWVNVEPHDFLSKDENDGAVRDTSTTAADGGVGKKNGKSKVASVRHNAIQTAEASRQRTNAVKLAWEDNEGEDDEGGETTKGGATEGTTFTQRLVRRILENLQVEIEDVHIAVRGCGVAAGLVLGSMSLVTTDAGGTRTFVDRKTNANVPESSFLYKELLISGFGIYLQDDAKRMLPSSVKNIIGAEYVLSPLSFQAKLRQSDLDHCVDFPKYQVHSKLSSLSIILSRHQLELGQRLAGVVSAQRSEVRPLFPEYRPVDPLTRKNAKEWWKYAVRCIGRLNRRRSWTEFYSAFCKRKVYVDLYKRHAHATTAPWLSVLTKSEITELDKIESDRTISIEGLMQWRSLADMQVGKEREKKAAASTASKRINDGAANLGKSPIKSSYASYLFGTTRGGTGSDTSSLATYDSLEDEINDAPITLTTDEMKELEDLAIRKADKSLTKDSMFCDVNFNLGSFRIDLLTATNSPLTSLAMGMVLASFKANADGSYTSSLSLLSLEVRDSVTIDTFYPTICRSLQKVGHTDKSQAFEFHLRKSMVGDQEVKLRMVACEIIASPVLLMALKEFFKPPDVKNGNNMSFTGKSNPLLYESSNGDADLFYDAKDLMGATTVIPPLDIVAPSNELISSATAGGGLYGTALKEEKVSDKLSTAIMDAWNGKNKQKQKWKIDCDISAPILILPESCTDPHATVLICNFGRFNFTFGTEVLSPTVLEWFQRARRKDSEIDHLKLEMNDLSFTISSVSESSKKRLDEMVVDVSTSVIEPISFTLDIGLEHTIMSGDTTPRTCVVGVLPSIILRLAPSHVTKMLGVAAIWVSILGNLRGDAPDSKPTLLAEVEEESLDPELDIMSSGSGSNISILDAPMSPVESGSASLTSKKTMLESLLITSQNSDASNAMEFMYVSVSLLRLSVNMYTNEGDGVEAHLVSVVASSSLFTDGTSSSRLSMGWFWMLDRLDSEQKLPRRQRLVCHSNLPRSATDYAENDQYAAIISDLSRQGVFKPGYAGSADLADITILKLTTKQARAYHEQSLDFSRGFMQSMSNVDSATVVNAKFTSLFINWNPTAIKTLFAAKSNVLNFKQKAYSTYEQVSMIQKDHRSSGHDIYSEVPIVIDNSEQNSLFILAEMVSFEISLNSAVDDMPLFTLTMSGSKVNRHTLEDDDINQEMSVVVGDFRMETCAFGRTLESYRTILGLAPSASTSLLSIRYSKGVNAVGSCNVGDADKSACDACAEIVLSPMRFVHIHSQVFTLIEYVSEGVFGALAYNVASSATAASIDTTKSPPNGERLFYIVASGFNFVLPQAAYSENYLSFHAGNFESHYRSLKDDIGSEIRMSLKDVSLQCNQNMQMVSTPVNMSVRVAMKPPFAKLTEDERATRIKVSISSIRLQIARCHYAQMMHTLEYNIGEQGTFLREENNNRVDALSGAAVHTIMKNLTHAGVENVEVIKRMYINFNIQELSVKLFGATFDNPIMSLAAVKAQILMKLLPDEKQTIANVALHDLVCDDVRIGSAERTFRRMIGRANNNNTTDHETEAFLINYTKYQEDESRDIEVKIGSSQVVILPDVISDVLNFITVAPLRYTKDVSTSSTPAKADQLNGNQMHEVVSADSPSKVEVYFSTDALPSLKKTAYRVESSNMRLVLVDMGSIDSSGPFMSNAKASTLTETIVLQGKMQARFEKTADVVSDTIVEKDYRIDAERVEIYTAQGVDMLHPVQIMEPAKFAVFYFQQVCDKTSTHLTDLKFVTLSPIDLTVSMQNAALTSTLLSSISDSFAVDEEKSSNENEFRRLSSNTASRIARLESDLLIDTEETNRDTFEQLSVVPDQSGESQNIKRVIRLKLTSPEATLTVTNDFQGLDEALFRICAMNAVVGGEITYPGISENEKPCFGCNMHTSILADYFDDASNRWTMLLTSPWELTFNASRAPQTRTTSKRMSSTFDVESSHCHVAFSEHFLVNVGAASRMWSVYSGATRQATRLVENNVTGEDSNQRRLSRSMAACAARSLITTLPYAVENHSGLNAYYSIHENPNRFPLPTNTTQFFRFQLFPERGSGGIRLYGQDIKHPKSIKLFIGDTEILVQDMDNEVNSSRSAHFVPSCHSYVFVNVVKSGNSTVLHLSSHVEMHNSSSLPFRIAVIGDDSVNDLGVLNKDNKRNRPVSDDSVSLIKENEDLMSHSVFGLPAPLLRGFTVDTSETICLQISPTLENQGDDDDLFGLFNMPPLDHLIKIAASDERRRVLTVVCSPSHRQTKVSSLAVNICCKVSLVGHARPFVELFIEPRLVMQNKMPVSLIVQTPMPHTFITSNASQPENSFEDPNYTTHIMKPLESVEVFTPGPSLAISMKCADLPIGGTSTGWVDGNFVDIPLNGRLLEPLRCTFPFQTKSLNRYETSRQVAGLTKGSDFHVVEEGDVTPDLDGTVKGRSIESQAGNRTIVFIVCNYAVDHTGTLLFEKVSGENENQRNLKSVAESLHVRSGLVSPPYSAFSSAHHRRRISLLPDSNTFIRLVKLTMDGEEGMKRSTPFRIEDCSMTQGIDSMPILWGDGAPSTYFAYRNLTAEGSELHVVPEFVIFNGSEHHQIWVKQLSQPQFSLDPLKISSISRDRNDSIVAQFEVPAINGLTGPVQMDKIGLRICVIKSKITGEALGSLAVQTVTGARDSRLVIKIGALHVKESETNADESSSGLFVHDFVRFRVRWSEMRVTLKDTEESTVKYEENRTAIRKYLEKHNVNSVELEKKLPEARHEYNLQGKEEKSFPEVAQILLHRFTIDFQRIFKEEDPTFKGSLPSNERAQFSIVVHNVRIMDCSTNTESPVIFDSVSEKSFFDLCVRTRGSLNADLIRVDLFDLNLAYSDGKADKITVNTGEDFVWRLLDIANRTILATAELAGVDLDLKWDDKTGKFLVSVSDPRLKDGDDLDLGTFVF